METGGAIQIALGTAKNVYKEDLENTVGDIEDWKITAFELIKSIVEGYRERKPEVLQSLKNRAQRFVVTQTSDPKWPQLNGKEPRVVVIHDLARSSLITFPVKFPLNADRKHPATYRLGEKVGERVCSL